MERTILPLPYIHIILSSPFFPASSNYHVTHLSFSFLSLGNFSLLIFSSFLDHFSIGDRACIQYCLLYNPLYLYVCVVSIFFKPISGLVRIFPNFNSVLMRLNLFHDDNCELGYMILFKGRIMIGNP